MPVIKDREIARMIYEGELMLVTKAAKQFDISASTIRSWIYHKQIDCYKLSPNYTYIYTQQLKEKMLAYAPRPNRRQTTLDFETA